jgi:hypothetical protein
MELTTQFGQDTSDFDPSFSGIEPFSVRYNPCNKVIVAISLASSPFLKKDVCFGE